MKTLKEVEALVGQQQQAIAGAKGDLKGAEEMVVRQLLDQPLYTQAELQEALGMPLEDLFEGNASQLRCLAVAAENGARCLPLLCFFINVIGPTNMLREHCFPNDNSEDSGKQACRQVMVAECT